MSASRDRARGIPFASLSALFLGVAPIFGKQAIQAGLPPLAVVAARTAGAAILLFLVVLVVNRRFLYIYPLGLLGCLIAGGLNGIGSILYYSGLARLDAGLAQLLYSLYPMLVAALLYLDGHRHTRLTLIRLGLAVPAVVLLTAASASRIDPLGILLMLGAAVLYALHIPINQRVLYEAPAPTVTLYTLLAMTAVVLPAFAFFSPPVAAVSSAALAPLAGLTAVTFLSRLTLFAGVKRIGGMQTTLLGLGELLVAVALAQLWLGETLTVFQWMGATLLAVALLLVGRDQGSEGEPAQGQGWLHWLLPPLSAPLPKPLDPLDSSQD